MMSNKNLQVSNFLKHRLEDKSYKDLPYIKKIITGHFKRNHSAIGRTMDDILERNLTDAEQHNLCLKSFDLAVEQTAQSIKDDLGLSNKELQELAENLDKKQLVEVINEGLGKGPRNKYGSLARNGSVDPLDVHRVMVTDRFFTNIDCHGGLKYRAVLY